MGQANRPARTSTSLCHTAAPTPFNMERTHGGAMRHSRATTKLALTGLLLCAAAVGWAQARTTLDIYILDVDGGGRHGGGAAALLVAPSGQSMLVDAGTGE